MSTSRIRWALLVAGLSSALVVGPGGAVSAQVGDPEATPETTRDQATEPGGTTDNEEPISTELSDDPTVQGPAQPTQAATTSSAPETTIETEPSDVWPASFAKMPRIVVETNDTDLTNDVTMKAKVLGGPTRIEVLPPGSVVEDRNAIVLSTEGGGAVQPLEPDAIRGLINALVGLQTLGFVRQVNTGEGEQSITIGIPLTEGQGAVPPELQVVKLAVDVPAPAVPDSTPPTEPVDATTGSEPSVFRDDPNDRPSGDAGNDTGAIVSTPAAPAGSEDAPETPGLQETKPSSEATNESGDDQSSVDEDESQQTNRLSTTSVPESTDDSDGPGLGFRGVSRLPSEAIPLQPVLGDSSKRSTGELSERLADATAETKLNVIIEFDLVTDDPAQPESPQFVMASQLTKADLVGPAPQLTDAPTATSTPAADEVAAGPGNDEGGRLDFLPYMLGVLVVLAGIAAAAVWFLTRRQGADDDAPGAYDGMPVGQPHAGGPPPPTAPRAPSDPTDGAALPVAAGTATLTELVFRGHVDARSQLLSLATVASVRGTDPSVASGSEGMEKWWGGPTGANGTMVGGWSEKIAGKGEDALPLALTTADMSQSLIAVADGLGGAGARTVSTSTGEATAARVASQLTIEELAAWWAQTNDAPRSDYLDLKRSIAGILRHQLRDQADAGVVGTLVREYPTTLAAATVTRTGSTAHVSVIWAGDSRVYLLNDQGLQLLTTDQVSGDTDELAQMYADPQMTNMISADRPFNLQVAETTLQDPFLLLTATDGCFGYLPSPAHLEAVLLEELQAADSESDWARKLTRCFNGVAGDDTSFAAMLFGGTFGGLQRGVRDRAEQVRNDQVLPVEAAVDGDARRQAIARGWQSYRNRFVARRSQMNVSSVEGE